MTLSIKKATLSNVPAIQILCKKLFESEINSGFDSNLDLNWSFSQEGKEEIIQRVSSPEQSCGFVAKDNDKIIGYLIGRVLEEETGREDTKYGDLEHMFVKKEYRGKGIGELLVNEFKTWLKEKNLKLIKVNVSFKNEKAINFYKKMGLMPVDVTMVEKIN